MVEGEKSFPAALTFRSGGAVDSENAVFTNVLIAELTKNTVRPREGSRVKAILRKPDPRRSSFSEVEGGPAGCVDTREANAWGVRAVKVLERVRFYS